MMHTYLRFFLLLRGWAFFGVRKRVITSARILLVRKAFGPCMTGNIISFVFIFRPFLVGMLDSHIWFSWCAGVMVDEKCEWDEAMDIFTILFDLFAHCDYAFLGQRYKLSALARHLRKPRS